jgi:hypothetical protein
MQTKESLNKIPTVKRELIKPEGLFLTKDDLINLDNICAHMPYQYAKPLELFFTSVRKNRETDKL